MPDTTLRIKEKNIKPAKANIWTCPSATCRAEFIVYAGQYEDVCPRCGKTIERKIPTFTLKEIPCTE